MKLKIFECEASRKRRGRRRSSSIQKKRKKKKKNEKNELLFSPKCIKNKDENKTKKEWWTACLQHQSSKAETFSLQTHMLHKSHANLIVKIQSFRRTSKSDCWNSVFHTDMQIWLSKFSLSEGHANMTVEIQSFRRTYKSIEIQSFRRTCKSDCWNSVFRKDMQIWLSKFSLSEEHANLTIEIQSFRRTSKSDCQNSVFQKGKSAQTKGATEVDRISFYSLLQRDQHHIITRLKTKHPASEMDVACLSISCHEIKYIEVDSGYFTCRQMIQVKKNMTIAINAVVPHWSGQSSNRWGVWMG